MTYYHVMIVTVCAIGCATASALAEGNGGTIFGYDRWQGANGNPVIPAIQWFNMNWEQRHAMQHKLQQEQAKQIWYNHEASSGWFRSLASE